MGERLTHLLPWANKEERVPPSCLACLRFRDFKTHSVEFLSGLFFTYYLLVTSSSSPPLFPVSHYLEKLPFVEQYSRIRKQRATRLVATLCPRQAPRLNSTSRHSKAAGRLQRQIPAHREFAPRLRTQPQR